MINRIVKVKEIDTVSNLWGDSITELHFRQDKTAWASNGEHATMIKYNPFTGAKMDYDNCPDYQLMPAYLIGETIMGIKMDGDNKTFNIVLSGGVRYEMFVDYVIPTSVGCDGYDGVIGGEIKDVLRDHKTSIKMDGTIGSIQYVKLWVKDKYIHFWWTVPTSQKLNIILKRID